MLHLRDHLPTAAAWADLVLHHAILHGHHIQRPHRHVRILCPSRKQGRPFGTQSRGIGRILLITARHQSSVSQLYGRPDVKSRVRSVRPLGRRKCHIHAPTFVRRELLDTPLLEVYLNPFFSHILGSLVGPTKVARFS